ncbi:MAG: hypothetical protein KGP28_12310 [Bdellovibrionales bacterium]|nr:hypothetical protein [Bdellovibrionales bacterium]
MRWVLDTAMLLKMLRYLAPLMIFQSICLAQTSPAPAPAPRGWAEEFENSKMDPVGNALKQSRILDADPIQVRINKLLWLLNHNNYLHYFDPDQDGTGSPPFQELGEVDQAEIRKIFGDGGYELDALRTTEQILRYRCGGHCSAHARSFAKLLEASGVSRDRIRIISAVNNDDFKKICPGKRGQARNANYRGGASGHVFVMVQLKPGDDKSWSLINTTQDPFRPLKEGQYRGTHSRELAELLRLPDHGSHKYQNAQSLLEKIDATDVEMTKWREFSFTPKALKKRVASKPVSIPEGIINSGPFKPMTIFSVESSESYLRHTFQERLNLIASGEVNNMKCRYDCEQVAGDKKECKDKGCVKLEIK